MESIVCTIERIIYHNPDNGFAVVSCLDKGNKTTLVGTIPTASVGSILDAQGDWVNDRKYGKQFKITSCTEKMPASAHAIQKYLAGGMVKGIGPKKAESIVARFGDKTFDIIENDPERLVEADGIGKKMVDKIVKSWKEQKEIRNIMLFLQEHDISPVFSVKIYKEYGDKSIAVIQENPYRLAEDIWGIGFKSADKIAQKLGFTKDCFVRIESGILYALNKATQDGHCFLTKEEVWKRATALLECEEAKIVMTLDDMIHRKKVIKEEEAIYIPSLYYSEQGIAGKLIKLINGRQDVSSLPANLTAWLKEKTGLTYEENQVEGIKTAVTNKVSVLTGGPGTGKTTTMLGIIKVLQYMKKEILLAAPTGRAAKRMSEATGMEAKTIHRLLGAKPPNEFTYNAENQLGGDVLLLDETSMLDVVLTNQLLRAVPDNMSVVFVGDIDQLPSVGPGNVLRDIIQSGQIPVVQLTKIFRQAAESQIIVNAHRINRGWMPVLDNHKGTDFFFVETENIAGMIVYLATKRLIGYRGIKPDDIQVLSPMKKGDAGTINLNEKIQEIVNPTGDFVKKGSTVFRKGDRVIQLKNNYEKDVFNGDVGKVEDIVIEEDNSKTLIIRYDERLIPYEKEDLMELSLAYALTIHKSQGSEYPVIIIPATRSHWIMLQRNLLYTGITRGKKMVVLVGDKSAIRRCVNNKIVEKRNTGLMRLLSDVL